MSSVIIYLKAVTGQFQTSLLNWAAHSLMASSAPADTLEVSDRSVCRGKYF